MSTLATLPAAMINRQRPLRIGLSCNRFAPDFNRDVYRGKELLYLERDSAAALARVGALPYMISDVGDRDYLRQVIADIDGLVLTPGADCSPTSYGQEPLKPQWCGDRKRDEFECTLVSLAREQGVPILGLCRGIQLLNVALGGTLYQDIVELRPDSLVHRDGQRYDQLEHVVTLAPNSWLATIYKTPQILVNTVHHQGVCDIAPDLQATAWAPDGVVEAVELINAETFMVGIQWHPEWLHSQGPRAAERSEGAPIFTAFLAEIRRRRGLT